MKRAGAQWGGAIFLVLRRKYANLFPVPRSASKHTHLPPRRWCGGSRRQSPGEGGKTICNTKEARCQKERETAAWTQLPLRLVPSLRSLSLGCARDSGPVIYRASGRQAGPHHRPETEEQAGPSSRQPNDASTGPLHPARQRFPPQQTARRHSGSTAQHGREEGTVPV